MWASRLAPLMLVFAHFGHWYVSMIYAAPALLLAGGLAFSTMRQKRRDAARSSEREKRE